MDLPRKSEAEQRRFFDDVLARARQAEARLGATEADIALAGTVIRFCFAGPAIAEALFPPIAHLQIPPSQKPDAVFHVWESGTSGLPMVQAPCLPTCFTHR